MNNFSLLIDKLELLSTRLIVLGDFNQDIINNQSSVLNFMSAKGFSQYVENSTTENGTLKDHVYVKGFTDIEVSTVPTYFSYHETIALKLKVKTVKCLLQLECDVNEYLPNISTKMYYD